MVCAGFTSTQATNNRAARVRKLVRSAAVYLLLILLALLATPAFDAVAPASIAPTSILAASAPALQSLRPSATSPEEAVGHNDHVNSAGPRGHTEREDSEGRDGRQGRDGLAGTLRAE